MDTKKIIFLFLLAPSLSWGMHLKLGSKDVELTKIKDFWITTGCKNCDAIKTMESLSKKEADEALAIKEYQTQSLGDRLCRGLKASVWTLKDEKEQVWSICEFKDKSAVLTDDLAGQFHKLK
jgi:hypothetical protein